MTTVHVGRLIIVYTDALTCVSTQIYKIQTGRERCVYCQRSTTYDVRAQTIKEKIIRRAPYARVFETFPYPFLPSIFALSETPVIIILTSK